MRKILFILLASFTFNLIHSQGNFTLQGNEESDKINFKFINNLIVIPVEINGAELTFLLDTGVSKPIIFNILNLKDSLTINETEKIYIRGLGEGESIEALKSKNNILKVGKAININQDLYAIFNDYLNFAPRLGIPIHGIIGYDLFKDFVVEVNYSYKYIKLHNPKTYIYKKCKKCKTVNLEFYNNKPYFNANVKVDEGLIPVKLLIDSGGSDSLWLFEDKEQNIILRHKHFMDFLGHGLSGSIYGKRSKTTELLINNFSLTQVNTAFPDSTSIAFAKRFKERNGSLSGGVLKRFNIIFDYRNAKMTLKKNRYFKEPFYYNKSGIELEQTGIRLVNEKVGSSFSPKDSGLTNANDSQNRVDINTTPKFELAVKPAYSIVELRKGSPAERSGLKIGDVILSANNRATHNYTLQEITQLFYDEDGKRIKLKIERKGVPLTFEFKLENPMK